MGELSTGMRRLLDIATVMAGSPGLVLLSLCDRVYCMEDGTVIAHGIPEEVHADPLVIASYLGTDPAAVDRSSSTAPPARRRTPPRKRAVLEEMS